MGAPMIFNPNSHPWIPVFDKEHIGIEEQLKQLDVFDKEHIGIDEQLKLLDPPDLAVQGYIFK
jgi:hypothetical protein